MSDIEDLEKLAELKEKGIITEQEFEKQKKFYLNSIGQQSPVGQSKGMVEYYIGCWKKSFQYAGRASRSEYWFFYLANFLISFVLGFLNGLFSVLVPVVGALFGLISSVYGIASIFPSCAVFVRRYHDIGKSGWFAFAPTLALVIIAPIIIISWFVSLYNEEAGNIGPAAFLGPIFLFLIAAIVGVVWGIVFPCMPSQEGRNKYGPNPYQ